MLTSARLALTLAAPVTDARVEARIERIVNALLPETEISDRYGPPATLKDRMAHYFTPGVSVAVVNEGRLEWARGFGVRERGGAEPVTAATLFQAGSISKPIFALALMRLAELGRLDLDEDVNRYLASWKVPPNGSWQPRVTLRQMAVLLEALRRPGETVAELLAASGAGAPPIPWSSYGFDKTFLRELPRGPGVYTFYDENDAVRYVGRSRNLRRRVGAYFREGAPRSARVQRIVEGVRRIEVACSGSDLEAVLREASAIARSRPRANVQREVHAGSRGARRLGSFVILEPAAPPWALRAYLIRDGRLVARVPIGPRGVQGRQIGF